LSILAEELPLKGTCDLVVEPFARVCNTAELGDQLRLAHLVQPNHRATQPIATGSPAALSWAAGRLLVSNDADQVGPDDQ
jgi:hypothetical protein